MFAMIVILVDDSWSWLCCMGVLFFSSCCSLWPLGEYENCMLSGSECFWVPTRFEHWDFQVECVSWYWKLILKNGDRLEGES